MERRQFIQHPAGSTLVTATALSGTKILDANDRVNVSLTGCGGRGRGDADLLLGVDPSFEGSMISQPAGQNAGSGRERNRTIRAIRTESPVASPLGGRPWVECGPNARPIAAVFHPAGTPASFPQVLGAAVDAAVATS